MTRPHYRIRLLAALLLMGPTSAAAQDSLGTFFTDPISFFGSGAAQTWVGNGTFFQRPYSDTLRITTDTSGSGLTIYRTLVRTSDSVVLSRGKGGIIPAGDGYAIRWNEPRFSDVTGHMNWIEDQWIISIEGEWSAWSVRVRKKSPNAFVAALARSLGRFPSVEVMSMTYRQTLTE